MHALPFDKPGRFYRGNLHSHSTRSDGRLTPEALCAFYREAGYDFLAVTDHFIESYKFPITDTRPYRTADFTTLLGAELHARSTANGELWHLLAAGLPLDFAPTPPDQDGPALAARAVAAGAYLAIAHPAWYALSEADVMSIDGAHAIEVYNAISHDHNDRADSLYMLDVMLNRGRRYLACAADDTHSDPARRDALGGWVMVRAEALEPEALLAALKAGHSYASSGPALHDIQVEPGQEVYRALFARRAHLRHRARLGNRFRLRAGHHRGPPEHRALQGRLLPGDRPRRARRPGLVQPDLVWDLSSDTRRARIDAIPRGRKVEHILSLRECRDESQPDQQCSAYFRDGLARPGWRP